MGLAVRRRHVIGSELRRGLEQHGDDLRDQQHGNHPGRQCTSVHRADPGRVVPEIGRWHAALSQQSRDRGTC